MSKKIRFVSGGALGADGRPLVWEVSREPALSKEVYVFVPGVAVEVSDSDAAWLLTPGNTRGRVFELVEPAAQGLSQSLAGGASNTSSPAQGPGLSSADAALAADQESAGKSKHSPAAGGR